jgi:hypothetical protein
MVPQLDRRIKRRSVPELEADRTEYQRILDDMVQNGGPLIPDPNWLITDDESQPAESYDKQKAFEVALSTQHYLTKVSKMTALMAAWVGGSQRPTQAAVAKYYRFLQHCDALSLWRANVEAPTDAVPLFRQDLGSLMDLNLLYAFSSSSRGKVTTLLEIGGGYGRLAEATFNIFGRTVKYVMVDAVPASLYYARKYLSCACPDAKIGSYYDTGDRFDLNGYDIAIVPAWHFERLNTLRYDICVNIESMQEMNQYHVDHYLNLFESVAVEGATIYLSNAHDYYFRGSFNYPTNWQKLICANTPRSSGLDHPTEIFRKTSQDCSLPNHVCDALHRYRLLAETPQESVTRHGVKNLITPLLNASSKRVISRARRYANRVARKCGLRSSRNHSE